MIAETVAAYALVLIFVDWDDCWNRAHKIGATHAYAVCQKVEVQRDPLAPLTSPRPRSRP